MVTSRDAWLAHHDDPRAGWKHHVDLVTISVAEPHHQPAVLAMGARHGPIEDFGGPQGYAELLSDLDDTAGPHHAATQAWLDGTLGPWQSSLTPTVSTCRRSIVG